MQAMTAVEAQDMTSARIEEQLISLMNEPMMRRPIGTLKVPRSPGNLLDHSIAGLPALQTLRVEAGLRDHLIPTLLPPRGRRPVTTPAQAQLAHAAPDVARDNESRTLVHMIQTEVKALERTALSIAAVHLQRRLGTKVGWTSVPFNNGREMWKFGSSGVSPTCQQKNRPWLCWLH